MPYGNTQFYLLSDTGERGPLQLQPWKVRLRGFYKFSYKSIEWFTARFLDSQKRAACNGLMNAGRTASGGKHSTVERENQPVKPMSSMLMLMLWRLYGQVQPVKPCRRRSDVCCVSCWCAARAWQTGRCFLQIIGRAASCRLVLPSRSRLWFWYRRYAMIPSRLWATSYIVYSGVGVKRKGALKFYRYAEFLIFFYVQTMCCWKLSFGVT